MASNKSDSFEGGCICGQTRYRLTAKPLVIHCCHCTWCQRETGSAFVLNALIETTSVVSIGKSTPYVSRVPTASGDGQEFHRCPNCQLAMWSKYGDNEHLRMVRVGTLDDPNAVGGPTIHIHTSTKQQWVDLRNSPIPVLDGHYSTKQYWPKESLERVALAREASKPEK